MGIAEEIGISHFKDNQNMAMVNLLYTANWFRDIHKTIFVKYDLLPQHYNVLRIVNGKYPDPISPGEIKKVMLDKGPDVTRLVDKLVKLKLVDRCLNENNRRSMEIRISKTGITTLKRINKELGQLPKGMLNLTELEAKQLSTLLDKARNT